MNFKKIIFTSFVLTASLLSVGYGQTTTVDSADAYIFINPQVMPVFIPEDKADLSYEELATSSDQNFLLFLGKLDYPRITWEEFPENTKLFLEFTIDESGDVTDFEIKRSIHPLIDEAVIEHVKTSRWHPGTTNGKAASTSMIIPLQIELE